MPGPLRRSLASRPVLAAVPRAARPTPPGRHRARGPGHPPGQPRLLRSPGAGACDLSLRTPPRHAEERCSLNRPTCPVTMTEGGDAGVRSATRPLWTAEPAGGAGPVEGPPRAEARGRGGRSCPRCDRSSAPTLSESLGCASSRAGSRPALAGQSGAQEPRRRSQAGRGEKGPVAGALGLGHTALCVCASAHSPHCPLSCPRERVCEMPAFHNSCPLVWFIVRDPA